MANLSIFICQYALAVTGSQLIGPVKRVSSIPPSNSSPSGLLFVVLLQGNKNYIFVSLHIVHSVSPEEPQRSQTIYGTFFKINSWSRRLSNKTCTGRSHEDATSAQPLSLKEWFLLAQVEGEDRFIHYLLCHHVVKNWVSKDLCQRRVAHPQNAIKLCHDKCGTRLVDWLSKLLVEGSQTPDLKYKTDDYVICTSSNQSFSQGQHSSKLLKACLV